MSPILHRAMRKPDDVPMMEKNPLAVATVDAPEGLSTGNKVLRVLVPSALIVLAGAVVFASFELGYWTSLGPGPGFFPFWIGIVLGASSIVWLIQALRGNPNVGPSAPEAQVVHDIDPGIASAPTAKARPIWVVLLSLVVMASLLDVLGFQLTMFAFLLFQLKFQGGRKWLQSLIIALIGSFGVFYLFTEVLQVTLPTSAIDFLQDLGL